MNYPKKLMSIKELSSLGYAEATLRKYARAKGSPIVLTAGGGKILFDTDRLDSFVEKYNREIWKDTARKEKIRNVKKSLKKSE